jgi:CDP-diglyceride synthetase
MKICIDDVVWVSNQKFEIFIMLHIIIRQEHRPTTTTMTVGRSSKWTDLPRRLATICIGVPILWSLLLSDFWRRVFWEGTHLVVALEWSIVVGSSQQQEPRRDGGGGPPPWWLFPLLSTLLVHCTSATMLIGALVLVTALAHILLPSEWTTALGRGLTLVSLPFHYWLKIGADADHGFRQTITLLLTVWNCDTGALVAGRLFGGKFMMMAQPQARLRSISPTKSMEGLMGGFVVGAITYAIMPCLWAWLGRCGVPVGRHVLFSLFETTTRRRGVDEWAKDGIIGGVLAAAAILGDLWESSLKRQYNVKDTSKLLPGHGKSHSHVVIADPISILIKIVFGQEAYWTGSTAACCRSFCTISF